jgi:hypothetical protein
VLAPVTAGILPTLAGIQQPFQNFYDGILYPKHTGPEEVFFTNWDFGGILGEKQCQCAKKLYTTFNPKLRKKTNRFNHSREKIFSTTYWTKAGFQATRQNDSYIFPEENHY